MKDYSQQEIFKINQATLRLFKRYLIVNNSETLINKDESLQYGILLDKDIDKALFDEVIKQYGIDGFILNQTLHKSFDKVAQEDLTTLYVEQILNYLTTYMKWDGIINDIFIPNEKLEIPDLKDGINLTFISEISEDDLSKKLLELSTNKIALSRQTVKDILTLSDFLIQEIDIECITNKELKIALYNKYDIVPKNNLEFVRFLVEKLTSRNLINDKRNYALINYMDVPDSNALDYLEQYQEKYGLEPLSEIFNRYKWLFVGLKRNPQDERRGFSSEVDNKRMERTKRLNHIVNRLYKLSQKNHKPFIDKNYINHIVDYIYSINDEYNKEELLTTYISKKSIWEVIKVANYLKTNSKLKLYKIRNGNIFIENKDYVREIPQWGINVFEKYLIDKVKANLSGKLVYLPKEIQYAVPQSEKQFVGNTPFNSVIELPKTGLIVGIHWTNLENKKYQGEERVDLDLKLFSNKYSVSWSTNYRSENAKILYSGDKTDAPISNGGSSEFIFVDPSIEDSVMTFRVNNFTNMVGPIPFEIIIAKADKIDYRNSLLSRQDYIVNPNNIIAKIPGIIEKGQSEHNIGVLNMTENETPKLILTNLSTSDLPVSKNNILDDYFREYLVNYTKNQVYLRDLLEKAGVEISDKPVKTVKTKIAWSKIKLENGTTVTVLNKDLDNYDENFTVIETNYLYNLEEVPVDIDLSLESLNKTTLIDIFKSM